MDLGQLLLEIVAFIGSTGGMSILAIAAGAAQLLLKVASSSIGDLAGKYKLLIVSGVSVASVVLGGLLAGSPLFSVILSGAGLAAIQVFIHQIYTHFFIKAAA